MEDLRKPSLSVSSCPDAVVVALRHVGVNEREPAAAIETCKAWKRAFTESCAGCLNVNLIFVTLEQVNRFAYWLTSGGHLVRSITLDMAEPEHIRIDDPGSQLGFALGLRIANQTSMLRSLQEYRSDLFCSSAVIRELPSNSLTSLELRWEGTSADPGCPPAAMGTALGMLTSLRSLVLAPLRRDPMPGPYLSAISSLSQLTLLRAVSMDPDDAFSYFPLLPHSLAALHVTMAARRAPHNNPIHLDLSHLSSLTALTFIATLSSSSRLPPSVSELKVAWDYASTIGLIAQLPRLKSLILYPGRDINLECITSLTSLTHLELEHDGSDEIIAAAPFWSQLPSLHRLSMVYDKDQTLPTYRLFTPAFFSQLGAVTTLTSLRFGWTSSENWLDSRDLEGFPEEVAKLKQLSCLTLSCLPLGLSAHHLTSLTKLTSLELSNCQLRNFAVVALGCSLKNLRHLDLDENWSLSDSCTPALGLLTRLTHLTLRGAEVSEDMGLMQLTTLKALQHLHLTHVSHERMEDFWDALTAGRIAVGA